MASHNYGEQSMSSSFKPDVSEALRNRQGCEVAHALKGMSAGEQLDAIRGYQRESKQDPQHYPKIDVNFDKNGYEIKAKPNPETNDSSKPNKSETILNHKMDHNDETTSQSCKNEKMKPQETMPAAANTASDSMQSTGSSSIGSDMSYAGNSDAMTGAQNSPQFDSGKGVESEGLKGGSSSDSQNSQNNNDSNGGLPPMSSGSDSASSSSSPSSGPYGGSQPHQ